MVIIIHDTVNLTHLAFIKEGVTVLMLRTFTKAHITNY